ncbi:MAG TPA: hypothetical protein VFD54_09575 [Anaerolineales bacterium]|nr:hypothetical protein [Anaerolineales bacterium]
MNFDVGEVLSRAWQITWKHRVLWIIGILFGFFMSTMFLLMFFPFLLPLLIQNSRMDLMPVFIVGFIIAFLLFFLVLYPISVFAQTSATLGILDANQDTEHFSASELIKKSLPFFWRVLGLMLLFAVGMNLIFFITQAIMFLLTIVTLGIAAICMTPIMFLMYPAFYIAIVWMEQAMNGIIIDNMTVTDAAKQGWNLIRNNFMSIALMALVVYFGIGLVTGILIVPIMIPLFVVPFSFIENEPNWTILSISMLCIAVFMPLFAFISGWSLIFTKSAWVLTYLRLTRGLAAQPILFEATSS